jgi:hypothetical protein
VAAGGGSREEERYLRELGRRGLLWVTFVPVDSVTGTLRLHEAGVNPRGRGYRKRILREWTGGRLRCMRKGNNMRAVLEDWRQRYGARSRVLELREREEVLSPEERGWKYRDEWRGHARVKIQEGKKAGIVGWNPDEPTRRAERRAASGDARAEARVLRDRLRARTIMPESVRLAACLGHVPAQLAIDWVPPEPPFGSPDCVMLTVAQDNEWGHRMAAGQWVRALVDALNIWGNNTHGHRPVPVWGNRHTLDTSGTSRSGSTLPGLLTLCTNWT